MSGTITASRISALCLNALITSTHVWREREREREGEVEGEEGKKGAISTYLIFSGLFSARRAGHLLAPARFTLPLPLLQFPRCYRVSYFHNKTNLIICTTV